MFQAHLRGDLTPANLAKIMGHRETNERASLKRMSRETIERLALWISSYCLSIRLSIYYAGLPCACVTML